jgi:hypothetical protein
MRRGEEFWYSDLILPAWLGLNSSKMNRESVIALVIQLTVTEVICFRRRPECPLRDGLDGLDGLATADYRGKLRLSHRRFLSNEIELKLV